MRVDVERQRVVGWGWRIPPSRGDIVLVDGLRCRVTRCRAKWSGPRWTIRSLRVKEAP